MPSEPQDIVEAIRLYADSLMRTQTRSTNKREAVRKKAVDEIGEQVYTLLHLQVTGWLPEKEPDAAS